MSNSVKCPNCGEEMRLMPDSDWQLFEVRSVDYMCPRCLHVERVKSIVIEGEETSCHTRQAGRDN